MKLLESFEEDLNLNSNESKTNRKIEITHAPEIIFDNYKNDQEFKNSQYTTTGNNLENNVHSLNIECKLN